MPSTLLITIYSWHGSITALAYVVTFFRGLTHITDRFQFVRIGRFSSKNISCTCGVPQGSVLGPILFNIYTSPIASIAESHNTRQQQYADDTQLYIALSAHIFSKSTFS